MTVDCRKLVRQLQAVPATTASLRAERRRISREVAGLPAAEVVDLARRLIQERAARFVAYELVLHHKPALASLTEADVAMLGEGMCHWGDVDAFACIVAGPAWREGRISDRLIHSWARSANWSWRRAALVSTVPLNSRARGGNGDARRTLAVCAMLIGDREDLVVKALSWALRELGKRDPASASRFVAEHREQLAPRVIREVGNKLVTGVKNPRTRGV